MKKDIPIIITGFVINTMTMTFGRFAYTLILPDMMRVLGVTNTRMGIFGMAIVIGYLLNSFLSGRLSGSIGEERTIQVSVFLSSLALFSLGFFSSQIILLFAFVGIGAGASGSYIPMISLLNHRFKRRGQIFGLVMGGTGVGVMLSGYIIPPLLLLSSSRGYKIAWYALAAINLIALFLSIIFLRNHTYRKENDSSEARKYLSIALFLKNRPLVITTTVYFLLGFSYIIYATFFGAYAINEIGFTRRVAGIMWSVFGVNTIYSGVLWGFFSDRYDKVRVATLVNGILAFSLFLIIPFGNEAFFYISTFLFGFAFMGFIIVITSIISDEVSKDEMAWIFGIATFFHGSGQVIGTFSAGYLKDLTNTFRVPFSLSFVILLVCIVLLLILHKKMNLMTECI